MVLALIMLAATARGLAQVPVEQTAVEHFPNYHPLIVHFPIVLLCLVAALQIGALFVKNRGYHYTILALAWLGYATAYFAAAWRHPHIEREAVSAVAQVIFDEHQLYARWSVWLGGAGAVLKSLELYFRKGYLLAVLTTLALIRVCLKSRCRIYEAWVLDRLTQRGRVLLRLVEWVAAAQRGEGGLKSWIN
jgi:uncharacterized membrane protein